MYICYEHSMYVLHIRIMGMVQYDIELHLMVSLGVWLVGWFYGISTFVGYLMPNPFLYK